MNADEFKPGQLAWATVDAGMARGRDVLVQRVCDDTWPWKTVADRRGITTNYERDRVTDLRSALVCGPDEKPAPKGSVVLDPEDREQVDALGQIYDRLNRECSVAIFCRPCFRAALTTFAAEQNAPAVPEPPHDALVWADGHAWEWVGEEAGNHWVRRPISDPENLWTAEWADLVGEDDLEVWHRTEADQ